MNLCLSGQADCYARTAYPSVVDEATAQMLHHRGRSDAQRGLQRGRCELAHRTGYQMRFTAVLFRGRRSPA